MSKDKIIGRAVAIVVIILILGLISSLIHMQDLQKSNDMLKEKVNNLTNQNKVYKEYGMSQTEASCVVVKDLLTHIYLTENRINYYPYIPYMQDYFGADCSQVAIDRWTLHP